MPETPITPDDPRLTAYILGELSAADRADVEARLATCAESRRLVDDLRDTTARLFEALQEEPTPALTEAHRASIRAAATNRESAPHRSPTPTVLRTNLRPQASHDQASHDQASHDQASRGRAAIAALLAVVAVSAAVVAALVVPFDAHRPTHSVATTLTDGNTELLALNTEIAHDFVDSDQTHFHLFGVEELTREAVDQNTNGQVILGVTPRIIIEPEEEAVQVVIGNPVVGNIEPEEAEAVARVVEQAPSAHTLFGEPGAVTTTEAAGQIDKRFRNRFLSRSVDSLSVSSPRAAGAASGEDLGRPSLMRRGTNAPRSREYGYEGLPAEIPRQATEYRVIGADGSGSIAEGRWYSMDNFTVELGVPFRPGAIELGVPPIVDRLVAPNATELATRLSIDVLRRGKAPGTEAYAPIVENAFVSPVEDPLSTFGLDVDTASYANVRRFLMDDGRWPVADAVRVEELVNYFAYSDPQPRDEHPLHVTLEAAVCPWDTSHRLVRIGVKGREIDLADRPPTSLVFLIDTSGSMRDENKLSLVKASLRLLVEEMTENDRIALVTYSDDAGLILDSTSGEHRDAIMAVIESLEANGSTNGEAGLKLAYDVASKHFLSGGTNRVILCTDGDFNVGESSDAPLVRMISEQRDTGVFLSVCGFGTGNLKDAKLEQIADHGNGQYHYVDSHRQARKVFLEELAGMLYTIAKDVKLQVEFNPAQVGAYRLIGYENRALTAEDFNNDRIDAGDLGAGHSVTALYEIVPPGGDAAKPASETPGVDPLKYQGAGTGGRGPETPPLAAPQREAPPRAPQPSNELLTVKLRYKPALAVGSRLSASDTDTSIKLDFPLIDKAGDESPSADLEWAAAVASFGMILRNSSYRGQSSIEGVLELARGAMGDDPTGDRREFIDLVLQARSLFRKATGTTTPRPPRLSSREARDKASVGGRYQTLLDKFDRPGDFDRYGDYYDAGRKDTSPDGQHPAGYWVYVFPHWYIWDETVPVSNAAPVPTP